MKVTTALRKISALKKRIWVIQGGQGAGKTISILLLLANHAYSQKDKQIFICSHELSKMRITVIKDFISVMKSVGIYEDDRFTDGTLYRFASGSFIKFIGLDKEDIGKGLRSDVVFINEANKVAFEAYRELTSRAKRVILDFNPNAEFYAHTDVLKRDDAELLVLTYKDNEYLSPQEVREIEMMRERAFIDLSKPDQPHNVKSEYWRNKWNVYGLGQIGVNPNRIFNWREIDLTEYAKITAKTYYGVDWGTVDPWGIIEAKYYDGNLYIRELNYASENEIMARLTPTEAHQVRAKDEGLVLWMFERLGIPKNAIIVCDDNRPGKVRALRDRGYDYAITANKGAGSILEGIGILEKLNVFYTSDSENIRYEQENYCRKIDRSGIVTEEPDDSNNHTLDPSRYVALFLRDNGIIKII